MTRGAEKAASTSSAPPSARAMRQRFLVLNRDRLNLARASLKKRQRIFVDVLPLLFHINHPALPGFVSKETPFGIADYSPMLQIVNAAMQINKNFYYERRAMHIYHIQAIHMIGSSGTIAYNEKSDFDIWVCHREELDVKQVQMLEAKCEGIRRWAAELDLEVNFFVMAAERFRRGEMHALSDESSGSAQYHLLLEEFYRTGLLLAGKYPAWWLVPPDYDGDYDDYLKQLHQTREIHDYEYIDFGDLTLIPPGEFFGAALWQLNKAISSPYKSILKLLLIESYAAEYPNMILLCTHFKRAVYSGGLSLTKLDPYLMMHNRVEEYLKDKQEYDRVELLRRCFYFKINKKLTQLSPRYLDSRHELMLSLVTEWGWDQATLKSLDNRSQWKIDKVIEERETLVHELTQSYQVLSDFARKNTSETHINSEDINLLGRRLYTAFERKSGKIELVNPGISTDLTEARLSFVMHYGLERNSWLLYNLDFDDAQKQKSAPLHRAQSMTELVAWSYFNRLISPQTLVTLHTSKGPLDAHELYAIIDTFRAHFPDGAPASPEIDKVKSAAQLTRALIFVNLGEDPLYSLTRRGVQLTTNRSDALSYSGFLKNLATSFDMLIETSWGELLTGYFEGPSSVMECTTGIFDWVRRQEPYISPEVHVFSFSSSRGGAIAQRIQQFLQDIGQVFYGSPRREHLKYIVNVGVEFFVMYSNNAKLHYTRLHSEAELLKDLAQPQDEFRQHIFDRYTLINHPLPAIMKLTRPDKVQMFFEVHRHECTVWISDERGSLFSQVMPFYTKRTMLNQFAKFLSTSILRRNAVEYVADQRSSVSTEVEYYQLSKSQSAKYVARRVEEDFEDGGQDYLSIHVIGDLSAQKDSVYNVYCGGMEFSALKYGDQVFRQVALHVIEKRKADGPYPLYIADIEVSRNLLNRAGIRHVQIIHYLNYKKLIEQRLNEALLTL